MPIITLEYTSNLPDRVDFTDLFSRIHRVLHETGGIRLDNCKSRARQVDEYYIGDGHPLNAFAQLTVRFVEGRSDEVKARIGERCLEILKQAYPVSVARLDVQITVEVGDIRLAGYFKYPEGTFTRQ